MSAANAVETSAQDDTVARTGTTRTVMLSEMSVANAVETSVQDDSIVKDPSTTLRMTWLFPQDDTVVRSG